MIALLVLLVGCGSSTDGLEGTYNVEADDGSQTTVTYDMADASGDWCKAGAEWEASHMAAGTGMETNAKWLIEGLTSEGLCHVVYTMETEEGTTKMDYYFNEEGTEGYFEIVGPDGQVIKQSFSA